MRWLTNTAYSCKKYNSFVKVGRGDAEFSEFERSVGESRHIKKDVGTLTEANSDHCLQGLDENL